MCTQEFSTALNRWCKHNGQSAPLLLTETRCRSKSTHDKQSASVVTKYVVDRDNDTLLLTQHICWVIITMLSRHQACLPTQQVFAEKAYFCWINSFCWLIEFLLIQHIFANSANFAETANFCLLTIFWAYWAYFTRHFPWHSVFLLNQLIFAATAIFFLAQHFLFSNHHAFLLTQQVFADIAYIC